MKTMVLGLLPNLLLVGMLAFPGALTAQDGPLKVEALDEASPETVAEPLREILSSDAIRVLDGQGDAFADFWVRQGIPVREKPAGPEGAVLYPVLEVGQVVGVVRFNEEAYDYKDQPIAPGLYSLRYGLQPINGDHLGISTHRDYLMLVPVQDETDLELIEQATLDIISADAAMTNHPAVFLLVAAPADASMPAAVHNQEKDQWGIVLPLPVRVEGQDAEETLQVQVVLVGRGPV